MSTSQEIRYLARLGVIGVLVLAIPFAVGLAIAHSLPIEVPNAESDVVDTLAVPLPDAPQGRPNP